MCSSLLDRIDDNSKSLVLSEFFNFRGYTTQFEQFNKYFEYHENELKRLRIGIIHSSRTISGIAAKSNRDIAHICQTIKQLKHLPRHDIREVLRERFPGEGNLAIDRSIDLTVRLWLMLNFRDHELALRTPYKPSIQWNDSCTFEQVIRNQFRNSTVELGREHTRLSPSFTVANMVKICGLELQWAESLEDHLRLNRKDKVLWVFPYKDFLNGHLLPCEATEKPIEILPQALLRETIMTLNMLFPQWDPATQRLLKKHRQTFHVMEPYLGPGRLDLCEFTYWRDRLVELLEEVYLAPPDTWRQLWIDRRNPHQYYAFWIALVILVLSIVSCAASIVQAWASIQALKLQMATSTSQ